ncbi:MAG: hypothetical protein PUF12_00495 [Thermoflexaceae bacterium]|nr:hypothetical protein [Thermoflexaceae bacterium]
MSVREYKGSVFSMLEGIPEYALDTYNALIRDMQDKIKFYFTGEGIIAYFDVK